MAKYTGPKHRLARREGVNILEKEGASLARRLTIPPGVHGPKGSRRKNSEYALQLREKQKVKRTYGLLERQFRRYYEKAGINLFSLLERRLDNAVYRLGLVPSRLMGRQLVSHGHVLVDGKKITIPSYSL
ncbi:30S ribosomal protein S4, partial [Candidatus Gottesmanbacteria bacterium]|nr:30S ribosomal protein S4 [Candidatus Gottesmanbacteria bacterium]